MSQFVLDRSDLNEAIVVPDHSTGLMLLEMLAQSMRGINFAIMMNTGSQYEVYLRPDQPCYGEFRKYAETHGEEYTRPEDDYRPDDLYNPFPDGVPVAASFGFNYFLSGPNTTWDKSGYKAEHPYDQPEWVTKIVNFMIGETSPWLSEESGIHLDRITRPDSNNQSVPIGVVVPHLRLDSTVLINLLNVMRSAVHIQNGWGKITPLFENHPRLLADPLIGTLFLTLFSAYTYEPSTKTIQTNCNRNTGYYLPYNFDLEAFVSRRPKLLSEGYMSEGFDYNRKKLHEVFDSGDKNISFLQDIISRFGDTAGVESLAEFIEDEVRKVRESVSAQNIGEAA